MFSEYKKQVIKLYEEKRDAMALPLNLQNPTPARLKDECLAVIAKRFKKGDEKVLRDFFGDCVDVEGYIRYIRSMDVDRFRPLINHLNKKTENTDEKNIELLAWLIDFSPRPYIFKLDTLKKEEDFVGHKEVEKPVAAGISSELEKESSKEVDKKLNRITVTKKPMYALFWHKSWKKLAISAISIFILLFSFKSLDFFKEKDCMYWDGVNYKSISCDQKLPNIQVIALDTFKLKHFKKITKPDTLTENCIRKMWYSKIDKEVEFFTTGGMHPEYPEKALKPISEYIFSKYIKVKAPSTPSK
ncbi:hypothetical protein [Pedobacter glucosidilyticus]|uniref:hypothetical protein n=1 Tax=Pedobacter glucosidilyticus TaxID=1122941 RepID=UPI0003F69D82|nr:hypothetical protein [Pedobacter glucosidilyticus]